VEAATAPIPAMAPTVDAAAMAPMLAMHTTEVPAEAMPPRDVTIRDLIMASPCVLFRLFWRACDAAIRNRTHNNHQDAGVE